MVRTALRNCTRDEGRSFEFGNQVLISSHRKLLSSKTMVSNANSFCQNFDCRHWPPRGRHHCGRLADGSDSM
jgi:hypothetical protein